MQGRGERRPVWELWVTRVIPGGVALEGDRQVNGKVGYLMDFNGCGLKDRSSGKGVRQEREKRGKKTWEKQNQSKKENKRQKKDLGGM